MAESEGKLVVPRCGSWADSCRRESLLPPALAFFWMVDEAEWDFLGFSSYALCERIDILIIVSLPWANKQFDLKICIITHHLRQPFYDPFNSLPITK